MARITVPGEPSYLSSSTGSGTYFLAYVGLTRTGALDVVEVTVDEYAKVVDVTHSEASRRRLRESFETIWQSMGLRTAPCPGAYVAWRIHQAMETHRARGHRTSPAWEHRLAHVPRVAAPEAHPAQEIGPVLDVEARVTQSTVLFEEPEIASWLPPFEGFKTVLTAAEPPEPGQVQIVQAVTPAVAPGVASADEGDPETAHFRRMERAIDEFYTVERRRELATRLRDTALVMAATRRPERAADLVALADAVETASVLTSSPPHTIPFVFGLFLLAMRHVARATAPRT